MSGWGRLPSPGRPGSSSAGDTSFQSFDSDSPTRQKPGRTQQPSSRSVQEKISKLANLGVDWVLPKQDVVIVDGGAEKLNLKESLISGQSPRSPVLSGGDLGAAANSGGFPPSPPQTGGFDQSGMADSQQFSFGEEAQWGDIPMEGEAEAPQRGKKKKKNKKDREQVTFGDAEEFYDGDSRAESRIAVAPEVLEVILTFIPGPLGIDADFATTGKLYSVHPGSQAAQAGVQPGWRMIKVNGQDYTELLLDQCIEGPRDYTITFQTKEREETATNGSSSPPPERENSNPQQQSAPGRPAPQTIAAKPRPTKKKSGFRFFCCGSKPKRGTLSDGDDD